MNADPADIRDDEMDDADQDDDEQLQDIGQPQSPTGGSGSAAQSAADKKNVQRGARACTVCRTAKMRCIGGDDQNSELTPCIRCKKANVACIFERHRRGRKPGSKLSEASKMRRQSKEGLSTSGRTPKSAAGPSFASSPVTPLPKVEEPTEDASMENRPSSSGSHPAPHPPQIYGEPYPSPLKMENTAARPYPGPYAPHYLQEAMGRQRSDSAAMRLGPSPSGSNGHIQSPQSPRGAPTSASSGDDEDPSSVNESIFPSVMLAKEKSRFLSTVMNNPANSGTAAQGRKIPPALNTQVSAWEPASIPELPPCFNPPKERLPDPIELGLLTESQAEELLALMHEHMNPFVNLFDRKLHTVQYIRARSTFLFTVLMMASCKFFKQDLFKKLQKMAYVFASRALDEQWKGVEVVQAFCCMVYWKEPEDNRAWVYIGYACRMAVELGLGYTPRRPKQNPTELEIRERRNRERTFLVLYVHDRSLSMQTGRLWMLPTNELIDKAKVWHLQGVPGEHRGEDLIVSAFVELRKLSSAMSDVFSLVKTNPADRGEALPEGLLNSCNKGLSDWVEDWEVKLESWGGNEFHRNVLRFFRLHVRLFLNSLGLMALAQSKSKAAVSLRALTLCYHSAKEALEVVEAFSNMKVLRYGQDVITVMSAYAAVFLLKLLRRSHATQGTVDANEVYRRIQQTAIAFYQAAEQGSPSTAARAHARFLQDLIDDVVLRARASEPQIIGGIGYPPQQNHEPADPANVVPPPSILPAVTYHQPQPQQHPQPPPQPDEKPYYEQQQTDQQLAGPSRPENLTIMTNNAGHQQHPQAQQLMMSANPTVYYSPMSAAPPSSAVQQQHPQYNVQTSFGSDGSSGGHTRVGSYTNGVVNIPGPAYAPTQNSGGYRQPQPQETLYIDGNMFDAQAIQQAQEQAQYAAQMAVQVPRDPTLDGIQTQYTDQIFEQLGMQYAPPDMYGMVQHQHITYQ